MEFTYFCGLSIISSHLVALTHSLDWSDVDRLSTEGDEVTMTTSHQLRRFVVDDVTAKYKANQISVEHDKVLT